MSLQLKLKGICGVEFHFAILFGYRYYLTPLFRDDVFSSTSDEDSISYNQYISTLYLGAGLVYAELSNLKIDANFKIATNVSIKEEDTHHQRNDIVTGSLGTYQADGIYFEGNYDDATLIEYNLNIAYILQNDIALYFGYTYTDLSIAKGSVTAYYLNTPYYSVSTGDSGGASHESTMYTLGAKFNF